MIECSGAGRVGLPLAVLALVLPASLAAQAPAGPALDYGPHGVGFTVLETYDSTRAFRPLRDFRGRLAAEPARPVQISIWYPARVRPDAPRMRAGEFRLLRETELDFERVIDAAEAEDLRASFIAGVAAFGRDPAAVARTWDGRTPAVRDAPRLPGPHPAVLHVGAVGVSDPLLPAYLASHGFVVASFPSNGRMTEGSLEFSPSPLTIDTRIDDAGFVYGVLRRLPYVDTRRLAVMSFSGASLAALLWAMRDMQPAAIVAVEGWERYRRGADLITTSVHYEPHRVRVPFLMIERAADETSPSYAKVPDVVEAMPYADITRVAFRDAAHGDFLSHAAFGHTPHHPAIYGASARMVRRFLEAHMGEPGGAFANALVPSEEAMFTMRRQPAVGPVPTEEELYRLAESDPESAAAAYREATRVVPGPSLFRAHVLRRAALFAPTPADSAIIMGIVRDAYPDTARAGAAGGPPRGPLAGADPTFLALSVSDLDAADAWYRRVLGLTLVREVASSDGALRGRVFSAGPVVVELIQHREPRAPSDALEPGAHRFQLQGIVKTGVFVADLDALFRHLRDRGVRTDARIGTDPELGVRFFVFRDLDDNRIQAFERCAGACE